MSMEAPTNTDDNDASKILELETEALTLTTTKSFWDNTTSFHLPPFPSESSSSTINSSRAVDNNNKSAATTKSKSTGFNTMAAVVVLFFAILVGMLLYFL